MGSIKAGGEKDGEKRVEAKRVEVGFVPFCLW